MIAMIVVNGWDFNQMRHVLLATAVTLCLVSIAHHARAADKSTTRFENDKTITVQTRTLPPVRETIFDVNIHRMREPAPRNACDTPTSSAFEIVSRDVVKCVGIVDRVR